MLGLNSATLELLGVPGTPPSEELESSGLVR